MQWECAGRLGTRFGIVSPCIFYQHRCILSAHALDVDFIPSLLLTIARGSVNYRAKFLKLLEKYYGGKQIIFEKVLKMYLNYNCFCRQLLDSFSQ